MFESLQKLPPDAILGLIAEHANDDRPEKIDLGVGVYRTAEGETPVLRSVKEAERRLLETQTSKAYLGTAGAADFNAAMQALTFGDSAPAERLVTLQTPGGSGALRVAAGLILRARKDATVWASEPTWANHVPLLGGAGLNLQPYPYYDAERHVLEVDAMLDALRAVPNGDIVLLHACCHNPSGLDPSEAEWRAIADVIVERELVHDRRADRAEVRLDPRRRHRFSQELESKIVVGDDPDVRTVPLVADEELPVAPLDE